MSQHALNTDPKSEPFPRPRAGARCSQRACAFAAIEAGLCRGHLLDRTRVSSLTGTCASALLGVAPYRETLSFSEEERKSRCRGVRNPHSKLNEETVVRLRAEAPGQSLKSLSRKYSVSLSTVWRVLRGTGWSHI